MLRIIYIIVFALSISISNGQDIPVINDSIDTRVINTDPKRLGGPPSEYLVVQIDTSFHLIQSEQVLTIKSKWISDLKILEELTPEIMDYKDELTEGIIIVRFKRTKEKRVKKILKIE